MREIVKFDILKVNHNIKKQCQCKNPSYEIDEENRFVTCIECGAIIDPFNALLNVTDRFEQIEDIQEKAIANIKSLKKDAEFWKSKRLTNRVFKNMELNFERDQFPVCPKCTKVIDPTKICGWANKRFEEEEHERD